jgi:hypothetical protein
LERNLEGFLRFLKDPMRIQKGQDPHRIVKDFPVSPDTIL